MSSEAKTGSKARFKCLFAFWALTLAFFAFPLTSYSRHTETPEKNEPQEFLFGGVSHVDLMPRLSEDLRKGAKFSLSALETGLQSNLWVRIPHWLAGRWQIDYETAVFRKDFKTNRAETRPYRFHARQNFLYGMQRDRSGDVWHYVGTPYKSVAHLWGTNEHHLVRSKIFERADQEVVRFRTVVAVVRVSKSSDKIKESYQQESITAYRPSKDENRIELSASTRSFNDSGSPSIQTDNIAEVQRTSPFEEIPYYRGKNMRVLFKAFLRLQGKENLIPEVP